MNGTPNSAFSRTDRIEALDALRGFDMFWIVGGRELALAVAGLFVTPLPRWFEYQFEHAEWEGFTAWDLIMPLFLFMVGTALPFSLARRVGKGQSKLQVYRRILRRCAILFLMGMVVQGHLLDFNLATLHIFCNTLQAIAVGYLVASVMLINFDVRGQVVATFLLLVGYWAILMYWPLQGHAGGTLLPDANVALAVDELVLGRFRDGTPYTWVLSGMTFAATVLMGAFAGQVLRSTNSPRWKLATLIILAALTLAAGAAWAKWFGFPIIKHIWTSSMALWAAGWSYLLLALFYWLIDVRGWRRWAFPFVVIGMNAITAYVAYFVLPFGEIAEHLAGGAARHLGPGGPVLVAAASVILLWLLLYHLYRQRIFLRL